MTGGKGGKGAEGDVAVGGTTTAARRGHAGKREAILGAAFAVFARRGYEGAGVQEIADEAGVAKLTVYHHVGDKERLFREALLAAAEAVLAENTAVVERLRQPGPDLRAALADAARRLARVCCDERSRSLRWLTYAQVARFPDLVGAVQERTALRLGDVLADRLARLALAGRLRPCDPQRAAEHFLALLTGPLEARSRLGTRRVSAAETRAVADAAVDAFLAAYGADGPEGAAGNVNER